MVFVLITNPSVEDNSRTKRDIEIWLLQIVSMSSCAYCKVIEVYKIGTEFFLGLSSAYGKGRRVAAFPCFIEHLTQFICCRLQRRAVHPNPPTPHLQHVHGILSGQDIEMERLECARHSRFRLRREAAAHQLAHWGDTLPAPEPGEFARLRHVRWHVDGDQDGGQCAEREADAEGAAGTSQACTRSWGR